MAFEENFRPLTEWRKDKHDRTEDAAFAFGYYLIKYCRTRALEDIPENTPPETQAIIEKAIDTALHNSMDLLEGYWKLPVDENLHAEFALTVNIFDDDNTVVESHDISPSKLDLPIGYWAWKDGDF